MGQAGRQAQPTHVLMPARIPPQGPGHSRWLNQKKSTRAAPHRQSLALATFNLTSSHHPPSHATTARAPRPTPHAHTLFTTAIADRQATDDDDDGSSRRKSIPSIPPPSFLGQTYLLAEDGAEAELDVREGLGRALRRGRHLHLGVHVLWWCFGGVGAASISSSYGQSRPKGTALFGSFDRSVGFDSRQALPSQHTQHNHRGHNVRPRPLPLAGRSVNQSTNQPINQSTNQSINQSTNRATASGSACWSVNQSIERRRHLRG